ncbi:MAG: bifunctional adenosylcobinamide kinase/adenosylcobinamide-phosphate guanylyltransferase [Nitrospiraceae bacterium]|nr:bifunctional adenosylcobinamide kinase/adenosylcobinamide-phosphate guanylyltransferase [Nitrospiraceae bacterium]
MAEISRRTVFLLGGARSGKSKFALAEASKIPGRRAFIATATANDAEMLQRIEKHRQARSSEWKTFEEPVKVPELLTGISGSFEVIVVDCLTLWLSNLMFSGRDIGEECGSFVSCIKTSPASLFVVANEVGLGIVPDNGLARQFRDLAGVLNQKVAATADDVFLMAAGIPVKIK